MKKKIVFICIVFAQITSLFLNFSAIALDEPVFSEPGDSEDDTGELSSAEPALADPSQEYPADVSEVIDLIEELEREIYLTNLLIELRDKGYTKDEVNLALEEEEEKWRAEKEMPSAEISEEIAEEMPEVIVARVVSEEPAKSFPPEDKSLITELEKKRKIEKIPATERYQPAPEDELYLSKELAPGTSNIIIEKEQTLLVPVAELERFTVTDPDILLASKEDDKIMITGTGLGKAHLHIWDRQGRRSVTVSVVQKGYKEYLKSRDYARRATEMRPFIAGYSFYRSRTNSKSDIASRSYHHTQWVHSVNISGETPWGTVKSGLKYEGQEEGGGTELKRDLTFWNFNLLYGEDIELSLGNTGAYFSDVTLPPMGFQGARLRNPDRKNINYDIFWGTQGSRMWGYKVSTWKNTNYFCGGRVQIEPADFIFFNTTLLRSLEDAEDTGEYAYAGGMGLNLMDDKLKIVSEFSRGKNEENEMHRHAYKIDTSLDLKEYDLLLKCTYRDIDPDFMVVSGQLLPYSGELGYYFDLDYNPFKYLRFSGKYDIYRDRTNFNPADTQVYNRDWQGNISFSLGRATNFNFSAWGMNLEGTSLPSHTSGESYALSHRLKLPEFVGSMPASLSLAYAPRRYRSLSSPAGDYRQNRLSCSMRLNVLKNLYYDLSHIWYHKHMIESGELGTTRSLSTGFTYNSQIFDTPFYTFLRLRYNEDFDVMENLRLATGEKILSGDAEIKYKPGSGFETYITVSRRRIRGVLSHSLNRQETRIIGGGGYSFDTTLSWGTGGSVKGYVFKDWNMNGIKDFSEEGLAGIRVYAGEYRSEVTAVDGSFEFERLKEKEALVLYDVKMLPEGYRPSTASGQTVKLERGYVSEVNFGVVAAGDISGTVFNDVNMNGVFDEGDEGVTGVLMRMDDGSMAQSGIRGYYRIEGAKVMTQTLSLDAVSLPFNLLPLGDTEKAIDVEAGKFYEEDFALYALRTVVGNVFIDKNGNKEFDSGEEGAADVVLRCGDAAAITDNNGRYFLKNLPGHAQKIILDTETIPSGYRLSVEPSRTVVLSPSGEIRENVNFALEKK